MSEEPDTPDERRARQMILEEVAKQLTGDPAMLLALLERELREAPEPDLARAVDLLRREMAESPGIVLIERAKCAGRMVGGTPERRVFVERPDGSLRPAAGADLTAIEARFPGFLRDWRVDED